MPRIVLRFLTATVLAMMLAGGSARAQTATVEVIPLRYRTAEQVIPVIQPLLGAEGTVSALQGQLIVRARPENLAEIRRLLDQIDKAPRRLMITVRQDTGAERGRREAELSGSVGNDNVRITVPGGNSREGGNVRIQEGDDRLRGHVIDSRTREANRNAQTIQVLEGNEAFIRVGQAVPVPSRQVRRTVGGGQVVDQTIDTVEYRDVTTGFYVRPRVSGNIVTLEISQQQQSLDRGRRGAVNVQQAVTTTSGRLGEWMVIGGVDVDRRASQSVLLGRSTRDEVENRRVTIMVEELH